MQYRIADVRLNGEVLSVKIYFLVELGKNLKYFLPIIYNVYGNNRKSGNGPGDEAGEFDLLPPS